MSRVLKFRMDSIAVKSEFGSEFKRFNIRTEQFEKLEDFLSLLEDRHTLSKIPFTIFYSDPRDDCLLPITNDDNFKKALDSAKRDLKVLIHRKGENPENPSNGSDNKLPSIFSPFSNPKSKLSISYPQDFRQVAAIIDVDAVPEHHRRVKLLKHGSDKPLGFYIRDGASVRIAADGELIRLPGIFISRLVPGGLAESTGLLAVNDEVIEVNGIEVNDKTLDQVTDMMVANSSNLIITVKPANQRPRTQGPHRGSFSRNSAMSSGSQQSTHSAYSDDEVYDQDEIRDLTCNTPLIGGPSLTTASNDEGILHL